MGNYTTNLGLYNTNMNTDGNDLFDFQRDLNDNNDKIDTAVGKLSTLNTTAQSSLVASINEVVSNCGALANLTTTEKSNLVGAINELVTGLGGKASKSLNNLNAVGQAIIDKKVEIEALLQQNGYAKFSWKENNVISSILIDWGVTNASVGDNAVTLPHAFTSLAVGVVSRATMNLDTAMTNAELAFPNQNKTWIKLNSGSNTNEVLHWIVVGF